jgi:carbamoyl-phosphate synthase large subunit
MKSVGEAMSIGRTFKEALQKGIRSMEIKRYGLGLDNNDLWLASCGTAFQAVNRSMGFQPMTQPEHGQDARATFRR